MTRIVSICGIVLFSGEGVLRLVDAAGAKQVPVNGYLEPATVAIDRVSKAMIMLGINCGFGNMDEASSAIDVRSPGCNEFPRLRTEMPCAVPVRLLARGMVRVRATLRTQSPRIVDGLRAVRLAKRIEPADRSLTPDGRPWVRAKFDGCDRLATDEKLVKALPEFLIVPSRTSDAPCARDSRGPA